MKVRIKGSDIVVKVEPYTGAPFRYYKVSREDERLVIDYFQYHSQVDKVNWGDWMGKDRTVPIVWTEQIKHGS